MTQQPNERPEGPYAIPDATRAPLHPIVEAAERVVHEFLNRWPVYSDTARDMIRVEVTRDVMRELRDYFGPTASVPYSEHEGPTKIMGVSYYVVDNLPEPGWRVLP